MKATQTAQHTPWYVADMGNDHQGLIVSEQDGRNIAVTYDKDDAPKIVRAVNCHDELLAAMEEAENALAGINPANVGETTATLDNVCHDLRAAIARATNG